WTLFFERDSRYNLNGNPRLGRRQAYEGGRDRRAEPSESSSSRARRRAARRTPGVSAIDPSRVEDFDHTAAGAREQGRVVNWNDFIIDAAATDTGMRRSNNQDNFSIVRAPHAEAWRQRGHVFLVADGMGAHAVGELASKMACDLIPHTYMKTRTGTPP